VRLYLAYIQFIRNFKEFSDINYPLCPEDTGIENNPQQAQLISIFKDCIEMIKLYNYNIGGTGAPAIFDIVRVLNNIESNVGKNNDPENIRKELDFIYIMKEITNTTLQN